MKTFKLLPSKIFSGILLVGAVFSTNSTAIAKSSDTVDLYRVPEATPEALEKIPKNLARWHMGASLVLIKDGQFQRIQVPDVGYFEESVFLSDNSALTYNIEEGQHNYIIDLGQFMQISRFFLNNQSAAGSFELASSDTLEEIDSRFWVKLSDNVEFEKGVIPSITFPEVETRYIHVRFNIDTAGTIGNFGATGPLKITQAAFNVGKGESEEETIQAQSPVLDYNFASGYTGTRIAYVSGGNIDEINNLLDEDPTTTYSFPANEECVIIVDMRKETQIRTFAANYRSQMSGLVQVYMVDHLPSQFENPEQIDVATIRDSEGNVVRAELAGNNDYSHLLAASQPREVVRVPEDYFLSIADSYQARVSADEDRLVQLFDDLERRYVIFRFIPQTKQGNSEIQTAVYRPGVDQQSAYQAQSSGMTFGQIEVIGDVQFDDIFFTLEDEELQPSGPPENPPSNPPVISQ